MNLENKSEEEIGEEYLSKISKLDLDKPEDRRLAILIVNQYHMCILTFLDTQMLDTELKSPNYSSLKNQWIKIRAKLEVTEEYEDSDLMELPFKISSIRGEVTHNPLISPSEERVNEFIQDSKDFKEEIISYAEEYNLISGENPQRTIKNIIERTLNLIGEESFPNQKDKLNKLNQEVEEVRIALEDVNDDEEITASLLNLLNKSEAIQQKYYQMKINKAKYQQHREEEQHRMRKRLID